MCQVAAGKRVRTGCRLIRHSPLVTANKTLDTGTLEELAVEREEKNCSKNKDSKETRDISRLVFSDACLFWKLCVPSL